MTLLATNRQNLGIFLDKMFNIKDLLHISSASALLRSGLVTLN